MTKIAVERGLDPVKSYLEQQGFQVVDMENEASSAKDASVICVTGADKNLMGMQDVVVNVPVVSCEGLSPEQVLERVREYVH